MKQFAKILISLICLSACEGESKFDEEIPFLPEQEDTIQVVKPVVSS